MNCSWVKLSFATSFKFRDFNFKISTIKNLKREAKIPRCIFLSFISKIIGGALGPIRNRKTVEKIIQNRKTEKNSIKTACKTVKTDTFSDPSYSNPDRSDTVETSGAYRVNYTNFITVFVNSMDFAFLFSSICLNDRLYFRSSLEDLERGLSGGNSHRSPL